MHSLLIIVGICAVSALALPIIPSLIAPGIVRNTAANLKLIASGEYKQNIEELSGQFEGDIVLNQDQYDMIFGLNSNRNGLIDREYRWLDNTVPYALDKVNHTQQQSNLIEESLRVIEQISCLKFIKRTDEEDYIQFTGANSGCYSFVGRKGGAQFLNLEPGCFRIGIIIHESFHALGFFHMQSSSERDEHVKIEWDHIIPDMEHNFNKYNTSIVTNFEHNYDYESIMHYGAYAFTKDGYATIVPNNISYINEIGTRLTLSSTDISKLNIMYGCKVPQ